MKIDPASLDAKEAHELLMGCVTPRPIAFVSTIGGNGVYNVAPFSCFTLMSMHPAIVGLLPVLHKISTSMKLLYFYL
jgi:flavin reductase (DIM6/NTAB) family NADH-FMN oxidoreductase RutF